ncbi:MAG: tRNA (cytidine(34)-2'-O)-methyltransferase [Thermaerobacterales bacterium]
MSQQQPLLPDPNLHIVLVAPEIAPNTGNIARTCAALGLRLHLVRPLGFVLTERALRRAGMDYWHRVDVQIHDGWEAFLTAVPDPAFYAMTSSAPRLYTEASFRQGDVLLFGSESTGLPPELIAAAGDRALRIPMRPGERSLNLASAVAVVAYAAMHHLGFPGVE